MLSISNFTQDLYTALSESRATLDAVIEEEKRAAVEATAVAIRQIAEQQQAIDEASSELLELEMKGLAVSDNSSTCGSATDRQAIEDQLQKQMAENEQLEATLETDKKKLEELMQERQQLRDQVVQSKQQLDEVETAAQTTVDDLTRGIVNYKCLGLDFKKADNEGLRFSFTQLDANAPDKKYSFELETTPDEYRYTIVELDPPNAIESARLEDLLETLNETNDMMPFIRGMREAFLEFIYNN